MDLPRPSASELSFDEWVEARAASLLRFAYLVTGSQQAAEDAVQTALTSAYEKWSRVSKTRDPDTYVRRMVVNAHVSGWRRVRRDSPVAEVRDTSGGNSTERVAASDAVWRMCERLPRQQRAAVVLRYYEDLEYAEIAAVLGVTEATARSNVHRALVALRQELAEEDGS